MQNINNLKDIAKQVAMENDDNYEDDLIDDYVEEYEEFNKNFAKKRWWVNIIIFLTDILETLINAAITIAITWAGKAVCD